MTCSFVVSNKHVLLFNVYLPCWPADESYCAEVGVIKSVLKSCWSIHHDIVIARDININFSLIEYEQTLNNLKIIIT